MIEQNGDLRCDNCHKKLGEHLEGMIQIVCPRCHYFNKFQTENADMTLAKVYSLLDKE